MSFTQRLRNRRAYARAKAKAGEDGMVCGIQDVDGNPKYFVVDRGASDEKVRSLAFMAKYGRPMNRAEELLDAAMNGDFVRAYEQAMSHYLGGRDASD